MHERQSGRNRNKTDNQENSWKQKKKYKHERGQGKNLARSVDLELQVTRGGEEGCV